MRSDNKKRDESQTVVISERAHKNLFKKGILNQTAIHVLPEAWVKNRKQNLVKPKRLIMGLECEEK